ncbi:MAG: cytidylate kinase-like family protein, partial [Clostridiales bacterium]|nr:cytidylate kinase-like family protein [Clostridiales bacterium]
MSERIIITLGRQFGSGGREIGKRVAKELGIAFYDKELLTRAAKESGISEELFQSNDEKPTNSLLYSLAMSNFSGEMPLNH